MKKGLTIGMMVLFVLALCSSCKTHQKCPAYGKVEASNIYAKK